MEFFLRSGMTPEAEPRASSASSTSSSPLDSLNSLLLPVLTPENIDKFRESCPFQMVQHGAMGFLFGGFLGLFLSGMGPTSYELRTASASVNAPLTKESVKSIFKDMGSKTLSSAKNLGKIAALFSIIECVIEGYRAKHDLYNTGIAGCASGAILGASGGPKAALAGCAGFAAFSVAVDKFMASR